MARVITSEGDRFCRPGVVVVRCFGLSSFPEPGQSIIFFVKCFVFAEDKKVLQRETIQRNILCYLSRD